MVLTKISIHLLVYLYLVFTIIPSTILLNLDAKYHKTKPPGPDVPWIDSVIHKPFLMPKWRKMVSKLFCQWFGEIFCVVISGFIVFGLYFFVYFLLYAFAKYHFSRTWKDKINYLFSAIQNGCRTINVKKLRSFGSFSHNENCTYVTIDDKIPIKKQRKYLS